MKKKLRKKPGKGTEKKKEKKNPENKGRQLGKT
jgi:hypothetical protein